MRKGNEYARVNDSNQVTHLKHRVLWETFNGPIPKGMQIDHIDGDHRNNNMTNLRLVTKAENAGNKALYRGNTSGVSGVSQHSNGKWRVVVVRDYKKHHLGYFADWFDAVCARMSANNQYGFHENHGRR